MCYLVVSPCLCWRFPAFTPINSNVIGLIFAGLLMLAVILNRFTGVMALPCQRCSRRISVTARWRRHLYFGAGCRSDATRRPGWSKARRI
ncbi:hypothetical protein ACNKHT_26855 [Shigella flexneri]